MGIMKKSLDRLYTKYLGNWVSVSKDYSQVYAHSKHLGGLVAEIEKRKIKRGLIMKVPNQKYSAYIG